MIKMVKGLLRDMLSCGGPFFCAGRVDVRKTFLKTAKTACQMGITIIEDFMFRI